MTPRLTPKQQAAADYLAAHPGATVEQICNAAGTSRSLENQNAFIRRLLDSGALTLDVAHQPQDA